MKKFLLPVIALISIAIVTIFICIFGANKDITSKEESAEAKLKKKTIETYLGPEDIPMDRYTLTFLIKGTKKSFDVSYDNYQKYEEQEEGILYHKRNKFVRFEKKDK